MKTVTSRDLAVFGESFTYEAWQAEEFFGRPFTPKPRRRIVQVEPQRIRAGYFVDQELIIGGQTRTPWWANPWHQLGIVLLIIAALFVIVVLSGNRIGVFIPS